MRLELTRIGNSRGIRIPKPLIEQCGLGDVVELGSRRRLGDRASSRARVTAGSRLCRCRSR